MLSNGFQFKLKIDIGRKCLLVPTGWTTVRRNEAFCGCFQTYTHRIPVRSNHAF